MSKTIIEQLADFTAGSRFDQLPDIVVEESKRIVLDSIGCAVAATEQTKGRIGIDYGRLLGGSVKGNATIMGTGDRVSVVGAAFANGELINALDMDCVVPPGHVSPYVLPGALAMGEALASSGKALIEAVAVSHEMSHRFGKAMDNLRDTKDGESTPPKVFGYASSIFGATAAIGKLKGHDGERLAHALGIAGCISPVNFQMSWYQHPPFSTIKYLVGGVMAQQAMTAAHLSEFGHQGDLHILDDREWGYPRFIGTTKWEPEHITTGLGSEWLFPTLTSFKPYAHCRIMHASIDCVIQIVRDNDIKPHEIDAIKVNVEGFAEQPIWLNRQIGHVNDAQFSMAHGIAMAAHQPGHGRAWMDPELVFGTSVMGLMDKITTQVHPDYVRLLTSHGASRPALVELRARGQTFVMEKRYPKGSPSPDPSTYMTNDELAAKFRLNAEGVLAAANIDAIVDAVMGLEDVNDVGAILRMTGARQADVANRVA
ncbi:MmgE/PrpD family protein [Variovorax sp. Sphag1AA]|uniref:MmgE/PrpD family protein n=1 Tax=Variovorax sp. Sphag1AA TaxID=2587027 RepID=UPI00161856D6|nr:MmgE/PrpD family protein [Variovorax sp. Sphag1AA]MBB3181136.1 2-methylcitrate dehydratase PrpD [Variovorax sp. Sphag1AA]